MRVLSEGAKIVMDVLRTGLGDGGVMWCGVMRKEGEVRVGKR